uniref:Uncharacterized protein n=1 Tax=Arion vulgaris TaxID=1028688 RepID=A0A0B6YJN9_9EUPU
MDAMLVPYSVKQYNTITQKHDVTYINMDMKNATGNDDSYSVLTIKDATQLTTNK